MNINTLLAAPTKVIPLQSLVNAKPPKKRKKKKKALTKAQWTAVRKMIRKDNKQDYKRFKRRRTIRPRWY